MGQRGFRDEDKMFQMPLQKQPAATTLADSVPWGSFRTLLQQGDVNERKHCREKRIETLILSKMLVMQQLSNLSDEELEVLDKERRTFEEFIGLGVMNTIPVSTTIGIDVGGNCKGFHALALRGGAYAGQLACRDVVELSH
ncbi:MAG: hypothetical protein ER33_07155 [Cyanobium sp. CACIAM 14]|nr:MAG: hypothetical protein ER33_07155 [Cyanobium sp. CACIAM 14]